MTLYNPIDSSPPGCPVPGIFQARTLEWVAIPSPMHESEKRKGSHSVVSDPQRPHGLHPSRLLHPWDFPGKSTGVGCHCLFGLGYEHSTYWIHALSFLFPAASLNFACVHAKSLQLCPTATLWILAHLAPLSWNSPGKNTGVRCHALLLEIFPSEGLNPCLLRLLHFQADSLQLAPTWEALLSLLSNYLLN